MQLSYINIDFPLVLVTLVELNGFVQIGKRTENQDDG
jgi:hypothetical protein